jgi:hypothetical protein
MIYVIEGSSALVKEIGEEQALKAGDFALVHPIPMKYISTAIRVTSP